MSDYVYLVYDTKNDLNDHKNDNIVAVVDNDEDFLRFMMMHQDEYPIKKNCEETYDSIWKKMLDGGENPDWASTYFDGITVFVFHINTDYGMKPDLANKEIDYLAKKIGIGHLKEPSV